MYKRAVGAKKDKKGKTESAERESRCVLRQTSRVDSARRQQEKKNQKPKKQSALVQTPAKTCFYDFHSRSL